MNTMNAANMKKKMTLLCGIRLRFQLRRDKPAQVVPFFPPQCQNSTCADVTVVNVICVAVVV